VQLSLKNFPVELSMGSNSSIVEHKMRLDKGEHMSLIVSSVRRRGGSQKEGNVEFVAVRLVSE
jgi:hypothetical protein